MKRIVMLLSAVAAIPVLSQPAAAQGGVAAAKANWQTVTSYLQRAAEQTPESLYAFRPVSTVRTFGQLIAHVAGAQGMFCSIALGETPKAEDEVEKAKSSKADLVAALKASSAYCERAYAMSDAESGKSVTLFGQNVTKLYAIMMNAVHNGEHYGNIVTYLRMKGLVPPSSQQGG